MNDTSLSPRDAPSDERYRPFWMTCSHCQGHGIVYGHLGEPADCHKCGGSGVERARDKNGRFMRGTVGEPQGKAKP